MTCKIKAMHWRIDRAHWMNTRHMIHDQASPQYIAIEATKYARGKQPERYTDHGIWCMGNKPFLRPAIRAAMAPLLPWPAYKAVAHD